MKAYVNLLKPILITGESGTGKSVLAKELFNQSAYFNKKFIVLHLGSIKEELIESELYGHKKGSFTGAIESKNGYFKEASGGTLFIDEIGELSLESQKKLLFALEEKQFIPVGDTTPIALNCRIIMATNKNLKEMVEQKKFREDLYFRITNFQLHVDPIRQDRDKLSRSIQHEFDNFKSEYSKPLLELSDELRLFLINYQWPGNYRELKNVLENLVALSSKKIITSEQLPSYLQPKTLLDPVKEDPSSPFFKSTYEESLAAFEAEYLAYMLIKYEGKVNETARQIKLSKAALIYKSKKYRINSLKMRSDTREKELLLAA